MTKKDFIQYLSLFLGLIFSQIGICQLSPPTLSHYTEKMGYPISTVQAIAQDNRDYLWLGTVKGLFSFDGYEFIQHPIFPENYIAEGPPEIFDLLYDENKDILWIATKADGIIRYDPVEDTIKLFNPKSYITGRPAGIKTAEFLLAEDGTLWASTHDGLIAIPKELDTMYLYQISNDANFLDGDPYENRLESITKDPNSNLFWIGSLRGIYTFNSLTGDFSKLNNPPFSFYSSDIISDIHFSEPNLFFGTWNQAGITIYKPSIGYSDYLELQTKNTINNSGASISSINSLDEKNILVTGTFGLSLISIKGTKIEASYPISNDVLFNPISYVHTSFEDKMGNIWLGHDKGLSKYPINSPFKNYKIPDNLQSSNHSRITGIYKNKAENICLSIYDIGITKINLNDNAYISKDVLTPNIPTNKILDLWEIGDSLVLLRIDNKLLSINKITGEDEILLDEKEFVESKLGGHLSGVYDPKRSRYWYGLGWGRGFGFIDINKKKTKVYSQSDFFHDSLYLQSGFETIILHSSGNIWFTTQKGVVQFQPESQSFVSYLFNPVRYPNGLIAPNCNGLAEDSEGFIWVASIGGGLNRIDPKLPPDQTMLFLNEDYGLPSKDIGYLCTDSFGKIWGTSDNGIFRLNPSTFEINQYDIHDGLPKNSLRSNPLELISKDLMVLRLGRSICWFKPSEFETIRNHPFLYIQKFLLGEKEVLIKPKEKIRLSYKENFFSVNFAALNFKHPNQNKYQYKLDGFDSDWVNTGKRNRIQYTAVPPGDYTLMVRMKSNDHNWTKPIVQHISITPPFWQTWWFYSLLAILIALILFRLNQIQISGVRKKEQLKASYEKQITAAQLEALRAQMNPHFLFNSLNSIKHFILKNDKLSASEYLSNFAHLVRQILRNSKSDKITLDTEIETLKLYLEMEKLRFQNKFDYSIYVQPNVESTLIKIPPLIIQPYAENAIWHGLVPSKKAGLLEIKVLKHGEDLLFNIKDNGIGRTASKKSKARLTTKKKSYGMQITGARIQVSDLGGKIVVIDLKDSLENACGTMVEITIPMKNLDTL